jgi:exonuclease III
MLKDFVRKHDIDVLFVQEITEAVLENWWGYTAHTNIGTTGRGTAFLIKEYLELQNIKYLPSGRGLAATLNGIWLINIYAPSGAERRRERDEFFATELPYLLQTIPDRMIMGGDFNCVLSQVDCTGKANYSGTLQELVRGHNLINAWNTGPQRGVYTHYTKKGATRIDRIYMTRNLQKNKSGVETVVSAMTDHLAVILQLTWDTPISERGRGYWKMNVALLSNEMFRDQLKENWERWKRNKRWYANKIEWWVKAVKQQIRKLFISFGTEKKRDMKNMEDFYYQCIYTILQDPQLRLEKMVEINRLKAKIVNIHSNRMEGVKRGVDETGNGMEERVSIYHIIRQKQHREQRTITNITDAKREKHKTSKNILSIP